MGFFFLSLLFAPAASLLHGPGLSRRAAVSAATAATAASLLPPLRAAHAKLPLTPDEQDNLDLLSRTSPEQLPTTTLPSGVVIYGARARQQHTYGIRNDTGARHTTDRRPIPPRLSHPDSHTTELYEGKGRLAEKGDRVYAHFKLWPNNFRSGAPADSSFANTRPYEWFLGQPNERMRKGFDEGVQGMREDGWRRIVIPPVRS